MHPAGLPPADSPFEAEDDRNFTTDAEMVGCLGFAPSSRRLRAGTSLSKFATRASTKAELNRRGEVCEASLTPGFRVAEMDEHEGSAPSTPVWKTGVYLSTPMPGKMESRAGIAPASAALQAAA